MPGGGGLRGSILRTEGRPGLNDFPVKVMDASGAGPKRWTRNALVMSLAVAAVLGMAVCRGPILRTMGATLVAQDPLSPADVIVVAIDAGAAGILETADLVHAGIAKRVAVFAQAPDAVDTEFVRRGFKYEDKAVMWRRMLATLGVTNVEQIPVPANSTEAEGLLLPGWCEEHHLHSIIVVTTPDHSRRVRRVLGRAMKGRATRVIVRPARVSSFDPKNWWRSRGGLRTGIVELEKLLLDIVRHPFS